MTWDGDTQTLYIEGSETLSCDFDHKTEVKKIIVSGNVKNLPYHCFYGCSNLEYITLPDSVVNIGNNIIGYTKVKEFRMPLNVTYLIYDQPFDHCYTLERFIVDDENTAFTAYEDALYSKNMTILYYYPGGRKQKTFVIPEGVTRIFRAAIAHSNILEEVIIPTSVKVVDASFGHYTGTLRSVVVNRIETENLQSTIDWGTDIYTFKGTIINYTDVKWVHSCYIPKLSYDCETLSFVYNSKCNKSDNEYSFNSTAFSGNTQIKSISFDYGLSEVNDTCFTGMSSLRKLNFPVTLKSIGYGCFKPSSLITYGCVSYASSIINVLTPHFSNYVLGISVISSRCRVNINGFINIILLFCQC